MKRPCVLLLLIVVGPGSAFAQTNTWQVLSPTPASHWEPADCCGSCTGRAMLANPPGRAFSGSVYGDGRIYYWGGGHNSYPANDMVVYDIATNQWIPDPTQPQCYYPGCLTTFTSDNYPQFCTWCQDTTGTNFNYCTGNHSIHCSSDTDCPGVGPCVLSGAIYDPNHCSAGPGHPPWDARCLWGSCQARLSGHSKSAYRCAGGSRDQLLCAVDADCTGGGACSRGIPSLPNWATPCTDCRPNATHTYQWVAWNPVRHTEMLAMADGTWEYNFSTRAFTGLGKPPPWAGSGGMELFWDAPRSRMVWLSNVNLGVYAFSYTTDVWTQIDTYPVATYGESYGSWDEQVNKFLYAVIQSNGAARWFLYDPSITGASAWTETTATVPADLKNVCAFGTAFPCFTSSITYDATNQRTIAMTMETGNTLQLWAYYAPTDRWQKITTGTVSVAGRSSGYPNNLHYDAGTGSLFFLDNGSSWEFGPSGHIGTLKITLDLGNPLPTQTPASTSTLTRTPIAPTPGGGASTPPITPTSGSSSCTKRVGPTRTYTTPSAAAAAAVDGDVICIDAGLYLGNVAHWTQNNLIVLGCDAAGNCPSRTRGDWPIFDPNGNSISSRGLWWVSGNNFTVNSVEFKCATSIGSCVGGSNPGTTCRFQSECLAGGSCSGPQPHCPGPGLFDGNDAGIRAQGHGLTVLNCYFHDNDDGILGSGDSCVGGANLGLDCQTDADCPSSTCAHGATDIESTEFFRNGLGDGQSHNVYIGRAQQATFKYNYSHGADTGHLLKTRAQTNYILYNRLTDELGTASEELDIASGGLSYVIGNVLQKAPISPNSAYLMKYAADPCCTLNAVQELYLLNNTFVSDCGTCGTGSNPYFVDAHVGTPLVWNYNNIFWPGAGHGGAVTLYAPAAFPAGTVSQGNNTAVTTNPLFVNQAAYNYQLLLGSPCIDLGTNKGMDGHGYALLPDHQYLYDLSGQVRTVLGAAPDIGAFEFLSGSPSKPISPCMLDAGVPCPTAP